MIQKNKSFVIGDAEEKGVGVSPTSIFINFVAD